MSSAPAYLKALVARRNAGHRIGDVVVSIGWPSDRLWRWIDRSPFARRVSLLATPEPHVAYSFTACVGLSCLVWCERQDDRGRAADLAESLCAAGALRVAVLHVNDAAVDWYRVAADWRVAA